MDVNVHESLQIKQNIDYERYYTFHIISRSYSRNSSGHKELRLLYAGYCLAYSILRMHFKCLKYSK